ncbi:NAD-dependent epimerase/dehydratase family protein [Lamprocystis purpurea]|jgi:NAD(P)-dependent dehydrogenase (short-subunit alcohol dehydrogenase family)|uniref:NAD-dependent epimerase/dehydratase family protein n=1 Tax=Lamprocystis purpurea TaxID=61598 RepID=UPI0003646AED|nr:SDR family NAD(P)-dependent oxidoreductase [Lamprocystis purpurea]
MKGVVSDSGGDLGARLCAALEKARWEVSRLPGGDLAATDNDVALQAALAEADALFLLDIRTDLPPAVLEARVRRLMAAADRAAVKRAILLSDAAVYAPVVGYPVPLRECDPLRPDGQGMPEAAHVALALERVFAGMPGHKVGRVVLRVPALYDRSDPDALTDLRAIMLGGAAACPPTPLQRLHPEDLCTAFIAAARLPHAQGNVFNIAEPTAIAPEVLLSELQRLGRLLSDSEATEDRVRQEYPREQPVLAIDKAARLLGFRTGHSTWVGLAECAQEIVFALRREGRVPDNKPRLPAVIAALESRSRPLTDKICVITSATVGIGRELAVILSRCGARVVAVGRDQEAGNALMRELEERPSCTPGELLIADISEMAQVRKLAADILARHPRVDVLVNNAGAVFASRQMTAEGIEATFAVNYLAHFLLTTLLLDAIPADGHIVNLISEIYRRSGLDFSDIFCSRSYDPLDAYGRAKFATVMFSNSLTERLGPSGPRVATVSPGIVRNETLDRAGLSERPELAPMSRGRMLSAEKAATHVAALLLEPRLAPLTGIYMDQDVQAPIAPATTDPAVCARLWQVSKALVEMV